MDLGIELPTDKITFIYLFIYNLKSVYDRQWKEF